MAPQAIARRITAVVAVLLLATGVIAVAWPGLISSGTKKVASAPTTTLPPVTAPPATTAPPTSTATPTTSTATPTTTSPAPGTSRGSAATGALAQTGSAPGLPLLAISLIMLGGAIVWTEEWARQDEAAPTERGSPRDRSRQRSRRWFGLRYQPRHFQSPTR